MSADPAGVVKLMIAPDGRVIAHAACFETGAPIGYTVAEIQEQRCRRSLAYTVIEALSSPAIGAAMDAYDAEKLVENMVRKGGFKVHTIVTGEPR